MEKKTKIDIKIIIMGTENMSIGPTLFKWVYNTL